MECVGYRKYNWPCGLLSNHEGSGGVEAQLLQTFELQHYMENSG
jgi:hypothetical protein